GRGPGAARPEGRARAPELHGARDVPQHGGHRAAVPPCGVPRAGARRGRRLPYRDRGAVRRRRPGADVPVDCIGGPKMTVDTLELRAPPTELEKSAGRLWAVYQRHSFSLPDSLPGFIDMMVWPAMDLLLWGLLTLFIQ